MRTSTMRSRLMATSMICGAMALGGAAAAQDAPAVAPAAAAAAEPASQPQELVVTGSRIPQTNLTSASPVTVVGSQEVQLQGTTRVEDLVNSLPQAFADQGGNISNAATGTATVNLRKLGSNRTLVLIDGRRMGPGGPDSPVADLNMIPASLVDRVEVLTGGASAVYGADAVAGVVNFIMKKNFEGIRLDAQYSFFEHDDNNGNIQDVINAKFPGQAPDGSFTAGQGWDVNVTMGANTNDGRGNITMYGGYRRIDSVSQSQYDYSYCALNPSSAIKPNYYACGGSGTTSPTRFLTGGQDLILSGTSLVPYNSTTDAFNFAPYNYYQRPDVRYSAGAFGHYEISEKADVYTQFMFMDDKTDALIAPSGIFGQVFDVPCNNPLMSASEVETLCTNQGLGPNDKTTLSIFKRNVEGGGRDDFRQHTDYRGVIGMKGALGDAWNYDVYAQYYVANLSRAGLDDFSITHIGNALNVTTDATGKAVCVSGPPCVPYNIFTEGGITQDQLDYLEVPGTQTGNTTEGVVSGSINGDLGKYGLKFPWAKDGVKIAVGAEYRRDTLFNEPDATLLNNDLAGTGGGTYQVDANYNVKELFGEVQVPVVQDQPFFYDLSLNAGYRYSAYGTHDNRSGDGNPDNSYNTSTYKLAIDWAPTSDIRFRASFNRAVRAPNIIELYYPKANGNDGSTDPCWGPDPASVNANATLANCERTGVTAAQYGHITQNTSPQTTGLTGGNPNLKPETANTYTLGFVLTPSWAALHGLAISADYFNIKVKNVIGKIGEDLILTQCLTSGDAFYCDKIHRDQRTGPTSGSLWLGGGTGPQAGYVEDTNFNVGGLRTSGVDITGDYRMRFADYGHDGWGSVDFSFVGTYLHDYDQEPIAGLGSYDCAGLFGDTCLTPAPKWRHKLRTTWSTPWDGLKLSLDWRYISGVELDKSSSSPFLSGTVISQDSHLPRENYFDLSGEWTYHDKYTLRIGVNNVFDKDPPLVTSQNLQQGGAGNGNTYPQIYDSLGRYIFIAVTASFM